MELATFYKRIAENKFYTNESRLKFYLEEQLFKNINFKNKSLLDIGGGNGLFGFYASLQGANNVVIMEPEFDGSQNDMINGFNKIKSLLGNPQNILHTNKVLEDYDRTNKTFDYILMHNSINHIDEDACITLLENDNSKKKYTQFFTLLREISHPGTILIICDCARSNFYSSINLKNPFAKSIEWEKHQNPSVWSNLLQQSGYKPLSTSWVSFNALGKIGGVFTANKLVSYFTNSHFKLVMQYTNN